MVFTYIRGCQVEVSVKLKEFLFRNLTASRPLAGRRPENSMCRPAAGRPQTKFVAAGWSPTGAGPQNSKTCQIRPISMWLATTQEYSKRCTLPHISSMKFQQTFIRYNNTIGRTCTVFTEYSLFITVSTEYTLITQNRDYTPRHTSFGKVPI